VSYKDDAAIFFLGWGNIHGGSSLLQSDEEGLAGRWNGICVASWADFFDRGRRRADRVSFFAIKRIDGEAGLTEPFTQHELDCLIDGQKPISYDFLCVTEPRRNFEDVGIAIGKTFNDRDPFWIELLLKR
jgi:hypothetical protein